MSNEKEVQKEVAREKSDGDFIERARKCDDMLNPEGEFNSNPSSEPWHYGPFSITRHEPDDKPTYLQLKDFDGVSQGLINVDKYLGFQQPGAKLRDELDERSEEVFNDL